MNHCFESLQAILEVLPPRAEDLRFLGQDQSDVLSADGKRQAHYIDVQFLDFAALNPLLCRQNGDEENKSAHALGY